MSSRDGSTVKYFAYGSNMNTQRPRERTPSAIARGIGYIVGYDLRFHKTKDSHCRLPLARREPAIRIYV
jgi:hypothetical protein